MAPWAWPWVPRWEDRQTDRLVRRELRCSGGKRDRKIIVFSGLLAMIWPDRE